MYHFVELPLVVFTALSPAAAVGFIITSISILGLKLSDAEVQKFSKLLIIPLGIMLVGLGFSTTHLGAPENALYVFSRLGSSPLSNEVFAAVVFVFIAGATWMLSFKGKFNAKVLKTGLVLSSLAAVGFIVVAVIAYSLYTVPTWDSVYAVAIFGLISLFGGLVLAACIIRLSKIDAKQYLKKVNLAGALTLVLTLAALVGQYFFLSGIENYATTALELVPSYIAYVIGFVVLGAAACALDYFANSKCEGDGSVSIVMTVAPVVLALAAALVVRVLFYSLYLPVGF